MFAGLIASVIGWGVPKSLAKPLLFVFAAAAIVIILGTAKCAYDASVIDKHDAKIEASQAKDDRKADNSAATQRQKDFERRVQEEQELKRVQTENSDPAVRKRKFYDCIRLQQAARKDGLQPPTC